jgi:hypothetical protein
MDHPLGRLIVVMISMGAACAAESEECGIWKMIPARSTFAGDTRPRSLVVRIETHTKGEVFTLDRIEADGRATSSSMILYFDGASRDFQDAGCLGTQSSRRVDSQTVEILRKCAGGDWVRLIRRSALPQMNLIFEITEQHSDGRRFERRLVLQKQAPSGLEERK